MNRDTQIAQTMSKFVDSKYAVDNPGRGEGQGWDCLNFLLTFYEDLGLQMPRKFEGWTRENYGGRVKEDPDGAHKMFEKFVQTLGTEIDPNYMRRGDLLLFRVEAAKDQGIYAGIFLGNGNAFMIFNKGGRVVPIAPFREHIISTRRLLK